METATTSGRPGYDDDAAETALLEPRADDSRVASLPILHDPTDGVRLSVEAAVAVAS